MRTIQVSEGTYAALWSRWKEGDDDEEGILRRLLELTIAAPVGNRKETGVGFRDARYGVEFPQGFEIFRVFKGKQYRAVADSGIWRQPDANRVARSLNVLSAQVGAPTENAWLGWHYLDGKKERPIADLRDPSKVRRRVA